MTNGVQNPGANQEALKKAEASLRDGVARFGNQHPEVLKLLLDYISLLRQCGNNEQADKLAPRAAALKEVLAKEEAARAAEAARLAAEQARAAEAARLAAEQAGAAEAAGAAGAGDQDKKAMLARKAEQAKAAAEEGVFDLDMFADDDEETMAMALELVKETPSPAKPASTVAVAAPSTAESGSSSELETGLMLYDSYGKHIAVAFKRGLYNPEGENIGRLLEDFEVYLDRQGWYLGHIVEGNRLARDTTWRHRDLNFGDRENEGHCAGWGRGPDVERVIFDRGFEDVTLGD